VVSTACTALGHECKREADAALQCRWHSLSGLIERTTTELYSWSRDWLPMKSYSNTHQRLRGSIAWRLHVVVVCRYFVWRSPLVGVSKNSEVGIRRGDCVPARDAAAARRERCWREMPTSLLIPAASSTSISSAKHNFNHTYQPQIWSSTTNSPCSARSARTTYVNTPGNKTYRRGNEE
jgi:hypothetical protein